MRQFLLFILRTVVLLPSYALVLLIRLLKWLIAPLALLIQLLFGIPLALLHVRQPLRPRFIAITERDLPNAAWVAMTDAAEALAAAGFRHYGDFRNDDLIAGFTLWLRLLGQSEQRIAALMVHAEPAVGKTHPPRQFLEFSTEFSDGRVLNLNNLNMPYSLPPPTFMARLQLKDVWDPRALYHLHRELVAALPQPANRIPLAVAAPDSADLLTNSYQREVRALIEDGYLRSNPQPDTARLSVRGALIGVWRQAWPLASLFLRAADRRARRLLTHYGLDAAAFAGSAGSIIVARQPLPEPITTVRAGYACVQALAQQTESRAVLEAVVVELDGAVPDNTSIAEFRYAFRSCDEQPERRIRRLHSFEVIINLADSTLDLTATDRETEQSADAEEWDELTAESPLTPLALGAWLHDLDTILPTAWQIFDQRAGAIRYTLDSASLYVNDGALRWQVVAWREDDTPLYVELDARSGLILES